MNKKVRKAIIPAAGLGTRFLPATKAIAKEMLPIVDIPTIQYIIQEAVDSGIEEILIITNSNKHAMENHFDKNYELEERLKESGKLEQVKMIQDIADMANIYYIRQKEPKGLGHAVLCAKSFIGDEPFAVLLGDDVVVNKEGKPALKQLIEQYSKTSASVIGVQTVDKKDVSKYSKLFKKENVQILFQLDNLVTSKLTGIFDVTLTADFYKFHRHPHYRDGKNEHNEKRYGHEDKLNEFYEEQNDQDYEKEFIPGNQWWIPAHDATEFGSKLLTNFIGKRFSFPKSLYAVHDVIRFFVTNNPNALIVDFFAGSGTTMHAVNLLNAEDGGHRRCIMVTNNEVSADEAKMLKDKGYQPGDAEWEKLGIAHYVTWPRTVCSIKGQDVNGAPLKGNYLGSEPPIHMADGFKANAAFFKLGFLDPTAVSLGMRFSEMLPTLWLKTGAKGKCPELTGEQMPDMLILPENQFAVLINENTFADFAEKLAEHPEIQTVFLATDYEVNYQSMVKNLNVVNAYQLYRDYLDHFRVNRGRN